MAAKDLFHDAVIEALEKDGWTITHDPYYLKLKTAKYPIDLGAERLLAAEKGNQKIAVEIKSFLRESAISEFHTALGQYMNYESGLSRQEADRTLFLALPEQAFQELTESPLFEVSIEDHPLNMVIFDPSKKEIIKWIS